MRYTRTRFDLFGILGFAVAGAMMLAPPPPDVGIVPGTPEAAGGSVTLPTDGGSPMLSQLFKIYKGEDPNEPDYVDTLAVARAEKAERDKQAQDFGLPDLGEPAYLVQGRERARALLGPRCVTHKDYKPQGESWEDFLRQPPRVLDAWRRTHPNPKQRITQAQVAAEQGTKVQPMRERRK